MKDEIRKELEDIAPRLAKIQRPEDVPQVEGKFFHNLKVDVLQAYKDRKVAGTARTKETAWWSFLALPKRPAIAMAFATMALLVVTTVLMWPKQKEENVFAELKTEEIYTYIEENIDDFEVELLMQSGLAPQKSLFQGMEEDGLEDYILDEIQGWDEDEWNDIL